MIKIFSNIIFVIRKQSKGIEMTCTNFYKKKWYVKKHTITTSY